MKQSKATDLEIAMRATNEMIKEHEDAMKRLAPGDGTRGLTTGVKHDHGKTNWSSMPWEALDQVAQVMTYGAGKYGTNNWRGGFKYSRVISAAFCHFTAWIRGENADEETGLSHLAHACCCLLFLLTFEQTKTGVDDRFKYEAAS